MHECPVVATLFLTEIMPPICDFQTATEQADYFLGLVAVAKITVFSIGCCQYLFIRSGVVGNQSQSSLDNVKPSPLKI